MVCLYFIIFDGNKEEEEWSDEDEKKIMMNWAQVLHYNVLGVKKKKITFYTFDR